MGFSRQEYWSGLPCPSPVNQILSDLSTMTCPSCVAPHSMAYFMANRWETMETVTDFILGGSQITADGDCSHEINRRLLLGRKVMTNLDKHITKQRHYFAHKFPSSQSFGFSSSHVWMWQLDYKAERWTIDAFELWCWRRLLRVPWTARRSNQAILKEISLEYSLEGLMLKLKLPSFGHLMWRTDSFEKTLCWERLKAEEKGMTEDEVVGWHHWLNGHEFE